MHEDILDLLPYKSSFRFVDAIDHLDDHSVKGAYTYRPDSFFYRDHFEGNPVTPGAILIETMAQIGLVTLAIYLLKKDHHHTQGPLMPALTSSDVSFYKMVLPGETVTVTSEREYFRFGKLKCKVRMTDKNNELIARGIFAGMAVNPKSPR